MTDRPFRWAFVATGGIARSAVNALALLPDQRLAAVVSRDPERGRRFLAEAGAVALPGARVVGDPVELAGDPGIDAAYIASPHPWHHRHARAFLARGTPALVEKPLAMSLAEAQDLVDTARANRAFLMEAMWTRCLPAVRQALGWIASGAIGRPRHLHASFCFAKPFDPASRLYDPALGGGALLDVGVYCLHLADAVFGRAPDRLHAEVAKAPTGVDGSTVLACGWDLGTAGGGLATLACAVDLAGSRDGVVTGDRGRIELPAFYATKTARLVDGDGRTTEHLVDEPGRGEHHQLAEVARCVRAGLAESPLVPHAATLGVARSIDRALRQAGIAYPPAG